MLPDVALSNLGVKSPIRYRYMAGGCLVFTVVLKLAYDQSG